MISRAPFGLGNKTQPRLRLLIVRARSSSWRCISAKPRVPYAQLKPIRVMATCHAATPCNTINISSCRSLRISYEAPCPNVCVWGILRRHHIQALFYWMGWRTYRERVLPVVNVQHVLLAVAPLDDPNHTPFPWVPRQSPTSPCAVLRRPRFLARLEDWAMMTKL